MANKKRKRDVKRRLIPRLKGSTVATWVIGGGIAAVVAAFAVAFVIDRGGGSPQESVITEETEVTVDIRDFEFEPADLTVRVGTTINWRNLDQVPHTATAEGVFDTDILSQGESSSITFDKPGTYRYICALHPWMTATIIVRDAA